MGNFRKLFLIFLLLFPTRFIYPQADSRAVLLPNSHILVCGGRDNSNPDSASDDCYLIYSYEYGVSIGTDRYSYPNILSSPRYGHTMTLLPDGRILVAGGYRTTGTPLATADIISFSNYDNVSSIAITTVSMISARAEHTATLLKNGPDAGNVLICGGYDGSNSLNSCEIFITSATAFKPGPTMTSTREGHSANLLPNGKVFIAGGFDRNNNVYHLTTELYDPVTNSMVPQSSLLVGRAYHTAITLQNGYTLIIGGKNGNLNGNDLFSLDEEKVQEKQRQFTMGYVELVEMFDQNGARAPVGINNINTGSDGSIKSELFPYRMAYHSSVLLNDGSVITVGGRGNIPVTYLNPQVVASQRSFLTLSNPQVSNPTGQRVISISSTSINLQIPDIRLSRYVIGRLIESDWFIPPKSDGSPTVQFTNSSVYLGITTATLDTVFVGGDESRGYGWLERVNVPLQGPGAGAFVLFDPMSIEAQNGTGSASLRGADDPLPAGQSTSLFDTTTATLTLSFQMPQEYWGANIIGATVTLKRASYENNEIKVTFNGGTGEMTNISIGTNGIVNTTVNFTNISGLVQNTTDHNVSFPYSINGNFTEINFDMSFTVDRINFYEDKQFSVDSSTIVVRDAIFSNISRYYPLKNELYMNDATHMGILSTPILNHTSLIQRSNSIYYIGGENCEVNPSGCTRSSTTFSQNIDMFTDAFFISDNWSDFPKMKNKRAFHTLTLLTDGSLLACGGTDGEKTLDTCELYNDYVGEWVVVATMTVPRAYHTATLLPNGTVLIAGGTSGRTTQSAALSNAEIFYPEVRRIVKTSPMNRARLLHTATLLPDGNVLFTGGVSSSTYLSSAEIFISTENRFIELSSQLSVPRSEHRATLLPNGSVLITGGLNGSGNVLSSCEIFNIQTRSFSSTDSMNFPRKAHTATLLDSGIVIVFGGSNNDQVVYTIEVFNPSSPAGSRWKPFEDYLGRANHKAVVLPDKTIAYIGGESIYPRGVVRTMNERLLADSGFIGGHGSGKRKIGTAAVLTKKNYIVSAGGFDGFNSYLDDVETIYYSGNLPDQYSFSSQTPRKPFISSATYISDNGDFLTIISTYSNLHSMTEASGGGSSSRSADFSKPYIVLTSLNGDYVVNLSTMLYVRTYNPSWQTTLSSITVRIPDRNRMPYGWYYLHLCVESICSDPYIIQISTPRPICDISKPTAIASSVGTSSMSWRWNLNDDITGGTVANGFAVFSSSDIFISTVPFPTPITAVTTFTLTGLSPNSPSALKIGCYNIGGFSDKTTWAVAASTIHTLAMPPKDLEITYASFDTVELKWDGNGNTPNYTAYQLEVSTDKSFDKRSIAINFANNYTDTKATIRNLEPNWRYYFRVKARNGDGIETAYDRESNPVSTITVGNIVGLFGMALSTTSIKWMWNPAGGANGYEVYDYKIAEDPNDPIFHSTIDVSVLIATTPYNYYTWTGLKVNMPYQVKVRSFKIDNFDGSTTTVYGPFAVSPIVHTLSIEPKPASPNVFTEITTGSMKITWDSNGNSTSTIYRLDISVDESFSDYKSVNVEADPTTFPFVSYVASELIPNTRYYARVYSINKDGIMNPTPAYLGSRYTRAQPPQSVSVSSITIKGVKLDWLTGDNPPYTIYQVRATSVSFESPYVSTPVPFGMGYTGNSYFITGLWLETTYYFDVAARNMEGFGTLPVQTTTPTFTLAGITGVPFGSTGGLVDPYEDTVIKGVFVDGRTATLTFYKGTFDRPTPIAFSSLSPSQLFSLVGSSNPCGYSFGGSTIAFGIYSNEQPQIPIKFTVNYFSSEAYGSDGISSNKARVTLARYNPQTGQCLPVKTEINTEVSGGGIGGEITSYINHFSIYQLIVMNPATSLSGVKVFPNPFYPNRAGQGHITIINLPNDSKLTFYTLSGTKVYETKANSGGTAYWDGKNSKGQPVGSGVYMCVIKSSYGSKTLKVAIER
ncbi:MAG: kelch repeat-containing protein [Elusimicrobiales bacterium]